MKRIVVILTLVAFCLTSFLALSACGGKQHWGQDLDAKEKWWKKEGHSWNRKTKIFMAIGYSNPQWDDKNAKRKSADLNASAEASKFMQQLMKTYIREANHDNYNVNEEIVESSSRETLIGSVIVSRKYIKKGQEYRSLLKVDLAYFFKNLNKRLMASERQRLKQKNRSLSPSEANENIINQLDIMDKKLNKIENKTLDKTFPE